MTTKTQHPDSMKSGIMFNRMDSFDSPLKEYIWSLCERERMSMREASLRAGLAPETVSMILRRGRNITPRPDTLRLLADALGGDFMHMMTLAGHIPPRPQPDEIPPEFRHKVDSILAIWQELLRTDPASARRLSDIALSQAEMVLGAYRAAQRANEEEEETETERLPDL